MAKLFSLLLLLSSCLHSIAQVTYGKDDCRYILNNWIGDLRRVHDAVGNQLTGQSLNQFDSWRQKALQEFKEGKFKIFDPPHEPATVNMSVITLIRTGTVVNANTAKTYFSGWDGLSEDQKELTRGMHFLFFTNKLEKDALACQTQVCGNVWTLYENLLQRKINPDNFYKYILDLVAYQKEQVVDFYEFYEAFYPQLISVTGLGAESVKDFQTDKYVAHFAPEILFAMGRYHEYRTGQLQKTNPISLIYNDEFGNNRYGVGYFRKLLANYYKQSLDLLIKEIEQFRNENCALPPVREPGKLKFTPTNSPITQKEETGIKLHLGKMEPGKGRLLVIQKRANGDYQDMNDHAWLYQATADGKRGKFYAMVYLNTYADVDPGTYHISAIKPTRDSVLTTVLEGNTKVIRFPEKGAISAVIGDIEKGEVKVNSMRIELLRQKKDNAYQFDTVFVDLWSGDKEPHELNPGLYRVAVRMPANYFPSYVYADEPVEISAHQHTRITVTGYSRLSLTALGGTGEKLEKLRVDFFSKTKNPKTDEYVHFRTYNIQDDIVLGPRSYRVVFQYAFPVVREIDITADDVKEWRIEDIGAIRITDGTLSKQSVEVIRNKTGEKLLVPNNSTINVESGQSYTVKCPASGTKKAQVFAAVKVEKGQVTMVNW